MNFAREHILDGTPDDIVARYESLPEFAAQADFGLLDSNVVIIDTETTGFSFNHDELIQIAAARIEGGKVADWYVTFVNPGKPIPEDIVHLTSITDQDVAGAPTPQQALEGLVGFAGDALMVAHNVNFDKTFTTRHPEGYPLLQNIWIDTLDLSRISLPRLKSHRLIDLVHTFGAPVSTHRADDDVAATCVVYRILLAAVAHMPHSLVRYIANMAPLDEWSTGFVFREIARLQNGETVPGSHVAELEESRGDAAGATAGGPAHADQEDDVFGSSTPQPGAALAAPQPGGTPDASARPLFSLHELRTRRILGLPARPARVDADDLEGQMSCPSAEEIASAFSAEGVLGSIYEGYEQRQEQLSMSQAIRDAFAHSTNLVVEAGTGVGKSMAYLVPAALFAQRNGVAVGIATKTNSLLDQLVYQELPALSAALQQHDLTREPLTWAPLKGMSHYPCLRKVNRLVDDGPAMREVSNNLVSQAPSLAALLSYIEQTEFDDMDSMKIDYRAIPRRLITTTSNECLRRKCPFFGKLCYVHGARRRAESADVLVTNHTLLFCDVAVDGGLLPTARHWVVDEAHSTESEARSAFAETVDSEALSRLVGRVAESAGARNVFTRAERSISSSSAEQLTLFFGLLAKARSAGEDFAKVCQDYLVRVKDLLFFDPVKRTRKGQSYDQVDIWINAEVRKSEVFAGVASIALQLVEASDKLIKAAQDVVAYLEGIDEAVVAQREIASCTMELREIRNALEIIFSLAPESYAYQATMHRKKDRHTDRIQALLLDVGEKMDEAFYARTHSVVYASATLSVGSSFDSFEQAVGLNRSELSQASELQLDSSYDFDNNMIVYVVSDMPEPNDPAYLGALNRLLVEVHRANRGSMLSLFTNRREMEASFAKVAPQLKADNLRVVCQKWGVSVKGLRDDFLADKHLSLFALKSFWEGFDAPGSTLSGVVIPKLPFGRPTDPLYCERAARDDRAWWHYVLPQAVIETKQAAGRLIRKADDHGVLILADKRLISKSYGKTFLSSLQSRTVRVRTTDEIVAALRLLNG